ncbi:MAG: glycoside hydrolase family 3 C-terminal domain-containing protein [Acidobacteriia bacterium]|nr:glycoside hydrolase family 3 C-terminal domain-containing protein [Terriglobia bacterium]
MTLDEKITGLGSSGVAVPRLGIRGPETGEALSGVVLGGLMQTFIQAIPGVTPEMIVKPTPTTQFPQGVGLARTWDPALVRQAGAVIGSEARYIFENGKNARAFLVLFTPNADLARDPRWGRTQEAYGEDPYFNGTMAAALIRGVQGDDPKYWQAASLLKHFLANSNENGRYGSSSDFDARLLREYYSAPFRRGFVEGGARSYMASYNAWNRVPMTVSPILKNLTAKEWGADGIICTDAGSLANLVSQHKAYRTLTEAAAASVKAGINMFLTVTEDYKAAVQEALAGRLIAEPDIDAVLRGSLRVSIRLGLLDPPASVPYSQLKGAPDPVNSRQHNAIAAQVARESIVLLKNSGGLLPLSRRSIQSVAVIGSLANAVLPDFYSGVSPYTVTPLDAIRARLGNRASVMYAADNADGAAVKAAQSAEVAIVFAGNHPTCGRTPQQLLQGLILGSPCAVPGDGMEGSDRQSLSLPGEDLIQTVYQANPRTVVVLVASAPYAILWTQENVPAILHASHAGQEEGNAIADVLFGDYNPAGRLVHTWVRSAEQLPPMMDYDIRHGRSYMYFDGRPLYPFGFGLSYASFRYSNLRAGAAALKSGGSIALSVDVANVGARDGDEVVQFYIRHMGSRVARPHQELRGFQRIHIPRGQTRTVTVTLKAADLAYWDEPANRWVVEPEMVRVLAGGSSADLKVERILRVE